MLPSLLITLQEPPPPQRAPTQQVTSLTGANNPCPMPDSTDIIVCGMPTNHRLGPPLPTDPDPLLPQAVTRIGPATVRAQGEQRRFDPAATISVTLPF